MEIRYIGFDQKQNSRDYHFDVREKGQPPRELTVSADMPAFRTYRIGIQEGPALSASKLSADLASGKEGAHELTGDDLRSHAEARAHAEAERAENRKAPRRRGASPEVLQRSPWRNFGL